MCLVVDGSCQMKVMMMMSWACGNRLQQQETFGVSRRIPVGGRKGELRGQSRITMTADASTRDLDFCASRIQDWNSVLTIRSEILT